ncbi:DUF350 domain-containing protein [Spiractinospora alimapuensis]|uniref:DUF350 domain-containing protein n=1 Tax=Spiractinospora alimapuensis TaxID=2820884 RepID=UPI001F43D3E8|nr:DUF350 domain-containing protein [Spiractinospora alimapuensis]QVQ53454.1 DUF350 domain-containing protein [Spiractinospora alimapuensis]
MVDILINAGAVLAYGAVGMIIMLLGYLALDLLTPGKLHVLIWEERNQNAVLLVSANTVALGIVVFASIFWASEGGALLTGLLSTAIYGLAGLVLMIVAFLLVDLLTPVRIGPLVQKAELHPATFVNAAAHVSVALVVAAALS